MFSEKLAELRKAKHISLDKMAEELNSQYNTNISKSMISRWEHGKTDPQMKYVRILADYFNVSSNEIMEYKDIDTKDSQKYKLLNIYDQLEPTRKSNVYNYAANQLNKQKNNYSSSFLGDDKHLVYIYGAVSAGTGEYIPQDDDKPEKVIVEGVVPDHDFAVRVNGDSMEPVFNDGQIIYVNKLDNVEVRNNQFVIAEVDGEFYVKKLKLEKGDVQLISLNKKYPNITIHEYNDFAIRGVVII